VRQWAILRLLADSGRSFAVRDLAEQLGASKSTIQRDLATLEREFALVVEEDGKQKKRYAIDQHIRALDSIQFTVLELLALHAAQSALSTLAGTPFFDELRAAMHKIRGFLSPRHNGGLDAMSRVFLPHARDHVDYAAQGDRIDDLADAIARRLVCRVRYHAAWRGTTRDHEIRPLRLVWHHGALYLLCIVTGKRRVTTLAVHRIRDLEVTEDVFAPPRIDVQKHIHRAFGIFVSDAEEEVEIRFDADVAWRVEERVFHPDERKERLPDGRLRYRLRSSAEWEIIPWVQSFGGLAELVTPASWRAALREHAEAVAARHGAKSSPAPAGGRHAEHTDA
jgi:predicted DNA-binding transcriptional regulator YafY